MSTQKQRLPARTIMYAAGAAAAGWLWQDLVPADAPGRVVGWWLMAGGLIVLAIVAWRHTGRLRGSSATLGRWSRRADRHDGMASAWQLWRVAGAQAMRRRAAVLRPSYAHTGRWRRLRAPATEFATRVARVGWLGVWSPVEDVTLRLGGPRTGKSGELACRILDAPGAVLATSTRTDLVSLTGGLRARRGPVHVFNPSGLGQLACTVKFSRLIGCRDPRVAADRAADLVGATNSGQGSGDREWWAGQARDVLTVLMHAAALVDQSMNTVAGWIADTASAQSPVLRALDRSPQPEVFREVARGFFGTNDRTQTSITASIRPALAWLTDATAAGCADGTEEAMLNIEQFLTDAGTLYLLGAEDAIVAPLVTALTAEIARTARRIAADQGGRLDPPLTLALDEAALICPVPLDRWTADMGGRNVTIHIGAQSRAQLRQRWGEVGAAAIVNNASTILVFGGMRDPDDLRAFEALSGEREDITYTRNPAGQITGSSTKRVPVLTAAQLANLPARRVMVVRRGLPASIGRVQMAWQRRTVRRAMRNTDRQPAGGIPTNAHHRGDQLVTEDQQQPTPTRNPAATPPVLPDFDGPFATARKE
jgi:type IV secretory pathway TraG/TraD family ATPase VirD4